MCNNVIFKEIINKSISIYNSNYFYIDASYHLKI